LADVLTSSSGARGTPSVTDVVHPILVGRGDAAADGFFTDTDSPLPVRIDVATGQRRAGGGKVRSVLLSLEHLRPVGTLTLLSRRPLPGHAVKYSERRAGDRTRRQGRDYAGM